MRLPNDMYDIKYPYREYNIDIDTRKQIKNKMQ